MTFQEIIRLEGYKFQNKIQGILKKYNLEVKILDKNNKNKSPDFLVRSNKNNRFIAECKSIVSDGYRNGRHISTHDANFAKGNQIDYSKLDLTKIENKMKEAVGQLEQLINDNPNQYDRHPFIVFLNLDFFADDFDFIPKNLFGFKKISAIAKIERDTERNEKLENWPSEKIKKIIRKEIKEKMPPESVRFKVLLNSNAKNKFDASIFLRNPIIIK